MRLGNYTIERKLAASATAEIFLAHANTAARTQVVLKKILPALAEQSELLAALRSEAALATHLAHDNIVKVYELCVDGTATFLVMEYVDGGDLATLLDRPGAPLLPLSVALSLFYDVSDALAYAHAACDRDGTPLHIVHRDVSPRNVLLTRSGRAKLTDFGIAKSPALEKTRTRTGNVKGTLTYLSPEQLQSLPIDNRADIFAGGILLYEMLTGSHPFAGDSDFDTMQNILDANPESCRALRPEIPEALAAVIRQALHFDPADRFATFADFKRALIAAGGFAGSTLTTAVYLQKSSALPRATRWRAWPWIAAAGILATTAIGLHARRTPPAPPPSMTPPVAMPESQAPLDLVAPPPSVFAPKRKPAAPSIAPASTAGSLRFVIRPWGQVSIDHHTIGATPLPIQQLSPGMHVVEISNPELDRHVERHVSIVSGEETVLHENLLKP